MYGILLVALGLAVASVAEAQSHRYFPLSEGGLWTLRYENRMVLGPGGPKFDRTTKGRMIGRAGPIVNRGGKDYRAVTWEYEDIPYWTKPVATWYRVDGRGLVAAYEEAGKFVENLELPAKVALGTAWDYGADADHSLSVTATGPWEGAAGRFADCITVTKKFKKADQAKQVKSWSVYCAGVGVVYTSSNLDLSGTISDTTTELVSFTKGR